MKTSDIVIKEKCIVLGIFKTNTFHYFLRKSGIIGYGEFESVIPGCNLLSVLLDVEFAANWAKQIIFVLDDVQFPINPSKSITCGELRLICENEQFFNKTVFVKGEEVINFDKNLVL